MKQIKTVIIGYLFVFFITIFLLTSSFTPKASKKVSSSASMIATNESTAVLASFEK